MFNFNKTFKNPKSGKELPKEFVDYLSKSAPPATKYIADEAGNVVLIPTDNEPTISGFSFDPSSEQKKDLGDNYSLSDLLDYLHNSQQPMRIKLNHPGYLTVNGKEIPAHQIAYSPRHDISYGDGIAEAIPEPFPGPFPMTIANDQYIKNLSIQRIPNRSVHEQVYESSKDDALTVRYTVNAATGLLNMSVNFSFSKATSVREVVECMSILNSWYKGEAILNGHTFKYQLKNNTLSTLNDGAFVFWKKVLEVESILDLHFDLPKSAPGPDAISDMETLYQGLVKQNPTIERTQITSFTTELDNSVERSVDLNTEVLIEFGSIFNRTVFNQEISLPAISMIFNAVFSKTEDKGKHRTFFLADVSDEKKMYTVVLPFKDEASREAYPKENRKEYIDAFRLAKHPNDFI